MGDLSIDSSLIMFISNAKRKTAISRRVAASMPVVLDPLIRAELDCSFNVSEEAWLP